MPRHKSARATVVSKKADNTILASLNKYTDLHNPATKEEDEDQGAQIQSVNSVTITIVSATNISSGNHRRTNSISNQCDAQWKRRRDDRTNNKSQSYSTKQWMRCKTNAQ